MRELTGREAIREALAEELTRDEAVFLMGEDITDYGGCFGVTGDLYKQFGKERGKKYAHVRDGYYQCICGRGHVGNEAGMRDHVHGFSYLRCRRTGKPGGQGHRNVYEAMPGSYGVPHAGRRCPEREDSIPRVWKRGSAIFRAWWW